MSRLTELLRQARNADPQLGSDLEKEVAALLRRRTFGLVFEQHQPEAVELPGRAVRRGDKVRVLPPRGETKQGDQRLWRVDRIERVDGTRIGHLTEIDAEQPEEQSVLVEDVVVVAEFRDRTYPGLVETGRVERGGPNKPFHTVINAENYHALEMLTYTHRHAVDAIYIDPPYNSGAKDWKYNNNYVEGDDDYRHSKWLAFMQRRLEIAKELLNPEDSVLIVTIDEKEYLRLGMLLEQTLPEAAIQMVTIVTNPNGVARGAEMSRVEEYAYFCFFGGAGPVKTNDSMLDQGVAKKERVRWEWLMRGGSNSRRADRPNLFYPIYIDEDAKKVVGVGEPLPLETPVTSVPERNGLKTLWPIRTSGEEANWRTSPEYLQELLDQGFAKLGAFDSKSGRWSVLYLGKAQIRRIEEGHLVITGEAPDGSKVVELGEAGMVRTPKTVWNRSRHSAGEHGSRMLRAMIPRRAFTFPKSLYAVEDSLRVAVGDKPDAVVLDFFSGSGTTAHALMRLNKQDGGARRSISVTNNEVSADEQRRLRKQGLLPGDPEWEALGICDYITKPRVTAAITGRTPEGDPIKGDYKFADEFPIAEGFKENAAFFTLTYEDPLSVRHHRAFQRVAPMLWLRAGSQGRIIDDLGEDGWDVAEAYGVLENIDRMGEFVARVGEVETVETAFVVTDSDVAFQMTCRDLPERVTAVRLYESYLHNFQINRRVGA